MEFFRLGLFLAEAFLAVALAIALFPALIFDPMAFLARSARWAFRLAAAIFLFGYCLAAPALAQAVATALNIPPALWDEINTLIIGTIVAVLGLAFKWVMAHSKLQNAQAQQLATDAFQDLLDKGAKYGATQMAAAEKNVGPINVGNASVAAAANFVIAHGPDLAKKVGVDITTDEGRAAVVRSVTLRIGQVMANSATTPPSIPLPTSVTPPSQ